MARREYYDLNGFQDVYLEDSYVLSIDEPSNSIVFEIDAVLTEKHPRYKLPKETEHYCMRRAKIIFPNLKSIRWEERSFKQFTDAAGAVDVGNIDEFYVEDDRYSLSGDWGRVIIESDVPKLELLAR